MKIALSGVVGAGKSTLSKSLSEQYDYLLLSEPVDENPYLDQYYVNPREFAFKMQVFVMMARSKQLREAKNYKNVLFDRFIYEDPIFVEVLFKLGYMDKTDYEVYKGFFDVVVKPTLYLDESIKPDIIFYLKADPNTAIERIKKRGRISEQSINETYWLSLNKEYEIWYKEYKKHFNIVVIDTDKLNAEEVLEAAKKAIDKFKKNNK